MPEASVVIPSRGGRHRLPGLLRALADQRDVEVEVIVVLDGDIDGSADYLAAEHPDVRAIVFAENLGRATALNAGFTAATGEVLIRCDDDLAPRPDYAAAHVRAHTGRTVGIVGICRDVLPDSAYARAYGNPRMDRLIAHSTELSGSDQAWRLWGGNVSVDRDTWERIGPYDDAFRGYGWEDVEWGYRLHVAAIPIEVAPDCEAGHLAASTDATTRALRAFDSGGSRRTFEVKHGPGSSGTDLPHGSRWADLVRTSGSRLDRAGVQRWGARVDRALSAVPPRVGNKLTALLVESASVAGWLQHGPEKR